MGTFSISIKRSFLLILLAPPPPLLPMRCLLHIRLHTYQLLLNYKKTSINKIVCKKKKKRKEIKTYFYLNKYQFNVNQDVEKEKERKNQ